MSDDVTTRFRENITEITAMLVTGLWLFLLLTGLGGGNLWLGVMLAGYIFVVPLVALLFGDEADRREWWDWWHDDWDEAESGSESESGKTEPSTADPSTDTPSTRDALETLRLRYAEGDLTDEQFERKLERLLEVETLEDVESWKTRRTSQDERREQDFERELE